MRDRTTISNEVVGRYSFSRLTPNAQALYFHLCFAADDEGVVNDPAAVLNKVCADSLDLEELISADFITSLGESGVFIRHWAQHVGIDD
jgi:hypothetical protein